MYHYIDDIFLIFRIALTGLRFGNKGMSEFEETIK